VFIYGGDLSNVLFRESMAFVLEVVIEVDFVREDDH
jgi:hypothetical protein